MLTTLKFLFALAGLGGATIAYLNLSMVESIYKCNGQARYSKQFVNQYSDNFPDGIDNPATPITGFLKIEEFSKLVLLWSDARHYVWWEIPEEMLSFWHNTRDLEQQLQLLDSKGNLEGAFSNISLTLSIVTSTTEFSGSCTKTS